MTDFGCAEIFRVKHAEHSIDNDDSNETETAHSECYKCDKQGLSIENGAYAAPKVFDGVSYDARKVDIWSLGMIFFQCLTGTSLYSAMDVMSMSNGYYALYHNQLLQYFQSKRFLKYFSNDSFHLFQQLVTIDDEQRICSTNILQHRWFSMYYEQYKSQIQRKFMKQKKSLIQQYEFMLQKQIEFPFYNPITY